MSFHLPPDAWEQLNSFLRLHPTCQLVFHVHEGHVKKMCLQQSVTVHESFVDREGTDVPVVFGERKNGHLRAT
jgi:hypothetical protein